MSIQCIKKNIFQIIVKYASFTFIENVIKTHFNLIDNSTENRKYLIPIALQRDDENLLQLLLNYFPYAPLNGTNTLMELDIYLLRDTLNYVNYNDIPLLHLIRNDKPELLLILFRFKSFSFHSLEREEKIKIFTLCLSARHNQTTMDDYHNIWYNNKLSPHGSINCLRVVIEQGKFNPCPFSSKSPIQFIMNPIYIYLKNGSERKYLDFNSIISREILLAYYHLIVNQFQLFSYLINYGCFQPTEYDLRRLADINYYIEDIFYETDKYVGVKRIMNNIQELIDIEQNNFKHYCTLKSICRSKIRSHIRKNKHLLILVEEQFNLNKHLKTYLKNI